MSVVGYRCKESFVIFPKGAAPIVVSAGDMITSTKDPRYAGHEGSFEPLEDYALRRHQPVEQATAEPGAKRTRIAPPAE